MGIKRKLKRFLKLFQREVNKPIYIPVVEGNLLKNRRIFISGGAGGIGFAIAEVCIRNKASVVLAGRSKKRLENAKKELISKTGCDKDNIYVSVIDVSDIKKIKSVFEETRLKIGNIDTLINVLRNYLPDEIQYYDKKDITNKPLTFTISEIVREKVFELTEEEVPHSLTCVVENMEKNNNSYLIQVAIIVDRDSLKKIVIGAHGSKIKEVGIRARKELEELLNKKVYLETYVKTIKNWRDKEKYLQEFGFNEFQDE